MLSGGDNEICCCAGFLKTAAAVVKLLVNRRVGASELEITFVDKVCVIEMLSAL